MLRSLVVPCVMQRKQCGELLALVLVDCVQSDSYRVDRVDADNGVEDSEKRGRELHVCFDFCYALICFDGLLKLDF
jgi:hypothetical protein